MLENDRRDPSWSFLCRLADELVTPVAMLVLLASAEDESASAETRDFSQRLATSLLPLLLSPASRE